MAGREKEGVSMMTLQEEQRAPVCERPTRINDTTNRTLDAIKAGLYSAGIDHDCLDFVAGYVMQALTELEKEGV